MVEIFLPWLAQFLNNFWIYNTGGFLVVVVWVVVVAVVWVVVSWPSRSGWDIRPEAGVVSRQSCSSSSSSSVSSSSSSVSSSILTFS